MSYTQRRANPRNIIAGLQKVFKQVAVKISPDVGVCKVFVTTLC